MDWTIRLTPLALNGLYSVPRGPAANVSATLRGLAQAPILLKASPAFGLPDTYTVEESGFVITYEVQTAQRIVLILTIE
jgi:mRNA-degrading endonuclease RelE of RelBE toxin-antitoxin system